MSAREAFLARVRKATLDGNTAGAAAPLPERGAVGYLGGGSDLLATFLEHAKMMGMKPAVVGSREELLAKIAEVLDAKNARRILLGRGPTIDLLNLEPWLAAAGREIIRPGAPKETLFAADFGISAAASLIAETGSFVIATSPEMSRTESLLPPVHIAIAMADQVDADLFDVLGKYSAERLPPSNLVFVSGPSKTGDIEMKLVTGVHGPGEVYVMVLKYQAPG